MVETAQIVCPHCGAVNRLPRERIADGGKCGSCHDVLFDGHPATLSAERFDKAISRNSIPVVVDFWAPWCGPCRVMAPAYEQAAAALEPNIRLAKLNTEDAQAIAARFNIASIPTLVAFRDGREIARMSGALPYERLVAWIRQATG